jgi:two-component system, chemotaxis family, chemotaxis protein CheY
MADCKLKILVADDSSVIHALFRRIAGHSPIPFDCVHAENGRECVDLLNRSDINMAFIDVNMPEMTGMEAVGAARLSGNKTFIVLMSALTSAVRLKLAHALKVHEYLNKPFTEDDVIAMLRTYLRVTVPVKALIVDDSATARKIVRKVLTSGVFNIAVTEAGDGEAAIACCESGGFDVVFLDCNMPGLDGIETLERLIARDAGAKVIMMTAQRTEAMRQRAIDAGATAFLYKPFSARDIDRELHALFALKLPELGANEAASVGDAAGWS